MAFLIILQSKPPPPPPSGFPMMPHVPGPGGPAAPPNSGPPVNMFSRKAGETRVIRCGFPNAMFDLA